MLRSAPSGERPPVQPQQTEAVLISHPSQIDASASCEMVSARDGTGHRATLLGGLPHLAHWRASASKIRGVGAVGDRVWGSQSQPRRRFLHKWPRTSERPPSEWGEDACGRQGRALHWERGREAEQWRALSLALGSVQDAAQRDKGETKTGWQGSQIVTAGEDRRLCSVTKPQVPTPARLGLGVGSPSRAGPQPLPAWWTRR